MAADYKRMIPFIKEWEGGLSKDPDDSAAANPAPCTYQMSNKWHTNKGITWQTFSSLSYYGYTPSCANFFAMPDTIWTTIYVRAFWQKMALHLYTSQAVADVIVNLCWGSGIGGGWKQVSKLVNLKFRSYGEAGSKYTWDNAKALAEVINKICKNRKGEKAFHSALIEQVRNFYISLDKPNYTEGWLNRLDDLAEYTSEVLGKGTSSNKTLYIVGGTVLLLGGYALWRYNQERNYQQSLTAFKPLY
jgi:lysozyme family protein